MKKILLVSLSAMILAVARPAVSEQAKITTGDLLEQMVSLERLSRAFSEGTRMIQFSSYDRASRVENGDTVDWWANADLGNYLREEETERGVEYVMAEASGPGAIVRLWSANPGSRTWCVYLDGSAEPVIEARGSDLLGGKTAPWGPAFSQVRNMGANLIFPIAFSKSVKVTVAKTSGAGGKPPLMYYQVDVRLYPAGVVVSPFTWKDVESLGPEMERVGGIIASPGGQAAPAGTTQRAEVELGAGAELFALEGPAQVVRLRAEVHAGDEDIADVLGRTLLEIWFDGQTEPAVSVPLGDFFGASPGVVEMQSLPSSIERIEGGARLTSRWVMPFRSRAVISLSNRSGKKAGISAEVITAPRQWGDDSLYFHAGWRQTTGLDTRPPLDMLMLEVAGGGNFVGLELNVRNHLKYFWWGEGDEKIWVDGEEFPSIFGTGTEDYFGYAWCVQYFKFTHAYHGVSLPTHEWLAVAQATPVPYLWESLSDTGSEGAIVSQYRFQVLDAIPFSKSFRFDMELLHHRKTLVDVNATTFWYAAEGSTDDAKTPDLYGREVWKE